MILFHATPSSSLPAGEGGEGTPAWFARLRCAPLLRLSDHHHGPSAAAAAAVVLCEARLVEVKGPGDSLSEHQKAWIEALAHMRATRPEGEGLEDEEGGGTADTPESEGEEDGGRARRREVARRFPLFELARVEGVAAGGGGGNGDGAGGGGKRPRTG